jgi:hypothetical protein
MVTIAKNWVSDVIETHNKFAKIHVLLHPLFGPTCFPEHLAKSYQQLQQKDQLMCRKHFKAYN